MTIFADGDIVKASIVISTEGVQTITKAFFKVLSQIGAATNQVNADNWSNLYWDAAKVLLSTGTKLELVKFQNVLSGDKILSVPDLPGTGGANPHPTHTTLRFTTYGDIGALAKIPRNQMCLAGLDEQFSVEDRLPDLSVAANLMNFLWSDTQTDLTNGVVVRPMVEHFQYVQKEVTDASNTSPIVVTSTAHGLANLEDVVIAKVLGNTASNGRFVVNNVTSNTFELFNDLGAPVAGNGAYTGGGSVRYLAPGQPTYHEATRARVTPTFRTLASRRSRLPV